MPSSATASRSSLMYVDGKEHSTSATLPMFTLAAVQPRKAVQRTTSIALAFLIGLSIYLFFFADTTLTLTPFGLRHPVTDTASRTSPYSSSPPRKVTEGNANKPQLILDVSQELAAVTSFIASHPHNVIPPGVDPTLPIDPEVVLDFDTRSPRAPEEVQTMVHDVWARNPLVLYAKFYSPASREIKALLAEMNLRPSPTIFDVDRRDDSAVLAPLLLRILGSDLPILLIGGKPVGSLENIRTLYESSELQQMLIHAGAVIDGAKRKKTWK